MLFNFTITGRLGNAIFRYMASVIMCIYFNGEYTIQNQQQYNLSDEQFIEIVKLIINDRSNIDIYKITNIYSNINGINMNRFYQHDLIYTLHKEEIYEFIKKHPEHYVLTDGIEAGDSNCEKYFMIDIINTPSTFLKKYKNVLHIRLEDFVTHNLYLNVERILDLLNKNIITDSLCIVCKTPTTTFEINYIKQITNFLTSKNLLYCVESNDTITDYYIMKESELLICSKSTLSWCAAFFSDKITKCYIPEYEITPNSSCKYPIQNTEFY